MIRRRRGRERAGSDCVADARWYHAHAMYTADKPLCKQTARVFIFVACTKTTKNDLADERVEALTGALSAKEIVCDAPRVFVARRD